MDVLGQARGERRRAGEDKADRPAGRGRRGHLGGHEGEALGGRGWRLEGGRSAPEHCSALQSVLLAGMAVPLAPWPCPLVSSSVRE